jgi:hypothetical protein
MKKNAQNIKEKIKGPSKEAKLGPSAKLSIITP